MQTIFYSTILIFLTIIFLSYKEISKIFRQNFRYNSKGSIVTIRQVTKKTQLCHNSLSSFLNYSTAEHIILTKHKHVQQNLLREVILKKVFASGVNTRLLLMRRAN